MRTIFGLAALAVVTMPASANAATLIAHLDGYIETQKAPGTDPNLSVGSKVTLDATYDSANVFRFGSASYQIAAPSTFRISSGSYNWIASDEMYDGNPVFTYDHYVQNADGSYDADLRQFGNPLLAIQGGKVVGLTGYFIRTSSSTIPGFSTNSDLYGSQTEYNFTPGGPVTTTYTGYGSLSQTFDIDSAFIYGNTAETPGFTGRWDFANSVAGVPEPATWAMMVVGFGAIGTAMRKRKRVTVSNA